MQHAAHDKTVPHDHQVLSPHPGRHSTAAVLPAAVVYWDAPLSLLDINDAQCGQEERSSIDGNVSWVLFCVLSKQRSNTGWQAAGNVGKDEHTGAIAELQLTDGVCRVRALAVAAAVQVAQASRQCWGLLMSTLHSQTECCGQRSCWRAVCT